MKRPALVCVLLMAMTGAGAQVISTSDVLGAHNLSPSGGSPVKGGLDACQFCHAPHSAIAQSNTPLWSQSLSVQTYTPYSSTTLQNTEVQPPLGGTSSLCLSCHDGTVAPGQTMPYGTIAMTGSMSGSDILGTNLESSHPFSLKLPLTDSPDLIQSLTTTHTTADPLKQVQLVNNNVECTTCHNPHVQGVDPLSLNFLVRDGSSGQLCLACHEVNARTVNGVNNPLTQWSTSIHATASNKAAIAANLGSYGTVGQNACLSCHMPHNSLGGARLLRGPAPPIANMDSATQSCFTCHNANSSLSPAIPNVFAEFAKIAHPYPAGNNLHDAGEPALLNNNRHTTCADCHNGHSSLQVASFASVPPPVIRGSQSGAVGVTSDGVTVVNPAVNQYETCLRCHGTSSGKQSLAIFGYLPLWAVSSGDLLNVIPQLSITATSSHPVLHDRYSPYPQPSLLSFMWNLDGKTQARAVGTRLFCTDCHNSDDAREFGGIGPNGPHGSQYSHLLERRYEMSQVVPAPAGGPGTAIQNLFPTPILDPSCGSYPCVSPYALCGKCHDLNRVMANTSFTQHSGHINEGFSCSACHTAHGMGGVSATISGERLVNFDANVVGSNNGLPISYSRSTNTCTLRCHNYNHNPDGSVTGVSAAVKTSTTRR